MLRTLISEHEGQGALADLAVLPIRRWPASALVARAYELRHAIAVADGVYVALAEALEVPLLT